MRIVVLSRIFWPERGGAAVVVRDLARAWVRSGHRVTVLAREANVGQVDPSEPYDVVRFPYVSGRIIATLQLGLKEYTWLRERRGQFDAVCVSMLKYPAVSALFGVDRTAPLVLKTEGAGTTGDAAWLRTSLLGPLVTRACRSANAIVAITPQIARELEGIGFAVSMIRHIPNGVAIPERPWSLHEVPSYRSRLGIPNRTTITYTGRLLLQKGLPDLIGSVKLLVESGRDIQLMLVGDGREKQQLEQVVIDHALRDRVHFVGHVSDVSPYLRASDLYVLPSYVEGLSISLLEALSHGMPSLASDIPANANVADREILPVFPTGQREALARAIEDMLGSSRPWETAPLRRSVAARYSIERVAAQYTELFKELGSNGDGQNRRAEAVA